MSQNVREIANFIWSVADELLRDNYKRSKYADVVYPFTVVRRLDCVLEPSYEKGLLYKVVKKFTDPVIALENLSNHEMGYVFEELTRKYNEATNENPGEHFTPREIIHLMVNILFAKDKKRLSQKGIITTVYDPACGTGGMLTVAKEEIQDLNPQAKIELFDQESNDETCAACKSDMLIKGEDPDKIKYGSSFSKDGFIGKHFDYILSNPPYGKKWLYDEEFIRAEAAQGDKGRFGAGLPGISDGQLLFLQHMISKMHTDGHQSALLSSSTVLPFLMAMRAKVNQKSAAGFAKTTGLMRVSVCPINFFTTPAFIHASGCLPTKKRMDVKAG